MGETYGGIEKLEIEYIKRLNSKNITLDLLVPNNNSINNYINSNIYTLNTNRNNIINRIKYDYKLLNFLKKNNYDIVHINSSSFIYSFRVTLISKICKIKKIIVHSHGITNKNFIKKIIYNLLYPIYIRLTDEYLSCSESAKVSLFKNKENVKILKNGIDVDKYRFNYNIRNELRKKYNVQDNIVYGNISRFSKEKNHEFLLDLFYEIQKKQKNSILILVGTGELEDNIISKIKNLKIDDKVILLGFRNDANELLNMMDFFIFPSIKEGLGLSIIESQTNGLITYVSNGIPDEANISPFFNSFDLSDNMEDIVRRIINKKIKTINRKEAYIYTKEKGYDINDTSKELRNIYLGI